MLSKFSTEKVTLPIQTVFVSLTDFFHNLSVHKTRKKLKLFVPYIPKDESRGLTAQFDKKIMLTLITELDKIAQDAKTLANDNDAFCYYVEDDERSDPALDELVNKLAAPIVDAIDCTACANCCRVLDVYLTSQDASRLAQGMRPKQDPITFQSQFVDLERAQSEDEWGVFKAKPCAFLAANLCTVYEHRPETCRDYPALTPGFRWHIRSMMGGFGLCPIIYNVMQNLKVALKW